MKIKVNDCIEELIKKRVVDKILWSIDFDETAGDNSVILFLQDKDGNNTSQLVIKNNNGEFELGLY